MSMEYMYTETTWRMSYKRQELLTLREHMVSPPVFIRYAHLFSFLCDVVFCVLFVFLLSLMYPMLSVSLDCLPPESYVSNVASVSGLSSS
jgi:hypothetical protein